MAFERAAGVGPRRDHQRERRSAGRPEVQPLRLWTALLCQPVNAGFDAAANEPG